MLSENPSQVSEVLMLIRSLASILIVASSFVLVRGQVPEAKIQPGDKGTTVNPPRVERLRDLQFGAFGIDLQFLIKELAKDMDMNVLFDTEFFRTPGRKVYIDLKHVTSAKAIEYILRQEGLISEDVGPNTILIAHRSRGMWVPELGIGLTPLTDQLQQYFGVKGGILVNNVRDGSLAAKAGLKAGDVIVTVDGQRINNALGVMTALDAGKAKDHILMIVRDKKEEAVTIKPLIP
jgi:membrane-associated protease RseP (regulator of RpoE activity)